MKTLGKNGLLAEKKKGLHLLLLTDFEILSQLSLSLVCVPYFSSLGTGGQFPNK